MGTRREDDERTRQQDEIDVEAAVSDAVLGDVPGAARHRHLDRREAELDKRERRLDGRAAELDEHEADQARRGAALDDREVTADRRENQADQREINAETAWCDARPHQTGPVTHPRHTDEDDERSRRRDR